MDNTIKRKVAAIMAAGVFFTTAGYSISQYQKNDKNTDKNIASSYQDDEKSEYEEYLKECDAFRRKYLIDNCIENSFGPFNYFGLPESVILNMQGHNLFDKKEIYIGNGVIDFALLDRMYQSKDMQEKGKSYITKWLNTAETPATSIGGHAMKVDKSLVFSLKDGEDVVMYSMCGKNSYGVSIERKINGISDYIRYLTFEPNQKGELVLTKDKIISLYRDELDNVYNTTETFDLITFELPDGSTKDSWRKSADIYLRYGEGQYKIFGSSSSGDSYEIISNFDKEIGEIGQYENTFLTVDSACFEDIEALIIAGDLEVAAKGFQSIIMSEKAKPLIIEPQK